MTPIKCSERLPADRQYVLAYFPDRPWIDRDAEADEHKWVVVKFVCGISIEERKAMDSLDPRRNTYRGEDQQSNNLVPYNWQQFGPGSFFGQEAECWCELPSNGHSIP